MNPWGLSWGDAWGSSWGADAVGEPIEVDAPHYGPTCSVVTPSKKRRRTANLPAVTRADISIVCAFGVKSTVGLSFLANVTGEENPAVTASAGLSSSAMVIAETKAKAEATADCYDTMLEMLIAA